MNSPSVSVPWAAGACTTTRRLLCHTSVAGGARSAAHRRPLAAGPDGPADLAGFGGRHASAIERAVRPFGGVEGIIARRTSRATRRPTIIRVPKGRSRVTDEMSPRSSRSRISDDVHNDGPPSSAIFGRSGASDSSPTPAAIMMPTSTSGMGAEIGGAFGGGAASRVRFTEAHRARPASWGNGPPLARSSAAALKHDRAPGDSSGPSPLDRPPPTTAGGRGRPHPRREPGDRRGQVVTGSIRAGHHVVVRDVVLKSSRRPR